MIHPIKSIQAHVQRWMINNFDKTPYGKNLRRYNNLYKGQRCFIVANGPSLRPEDLDKLSESGEISFGMNRINKIFDQTKWRPTFYVCEDELIAFGQQKEIEEIPSIEKFIPAEIQWYHDVKIRDAALFHINYQDENRYPYSFSTDIAKQIDCRGTVTFTCMQIAVYMVK